MSNLGVGMRGKKRGAGGRERKEKLVAKRFIVFSSKEESELGLIKNGQLTSRLSYTPAACDSLWRKTSHHKFFRSREKILCHSNFKPWTFSPTSFLYLQKLNLQFHPVGSAYCLQQDRKMRVLCPGPQPQNMNHILSHKMNRKNNNSQMSSLAIGNLANM